MQVLSSEYTTNQETFPRTSSSCLRTTDILLTKTNFTPSLYLFTFVTLVLKSSLIYSSVNYRFRKTREKLVSLRIKVFSTQIH